MSSDAGEQSSSPQPKVGAPFNQAYLRPSAPMKDSQRFRNRLAAYILNHSKLEIAGLVAFLQTQMGAEELHSTHRYSKDQIMNLVKTGDMGDVLSLITHVADHIRRKQGTPYFLASAHEWTSFIIKLLEEENLGYSIDRLCGVRYKIDIEFEQVRLAAVTHLGSPRYKAVLNEFETAYRAIEANPPDAKAAVRAMFEAIETLFRLMVGPKAKLLGSPEVKEFLPPMIRSLYTDPLAANTMIQLANGLADWVNGLQAYRHGQAVEEPSPPPMEAAVAALQTGSAYLRLLIELDRKVQSGSEGT